MVFLKKAKEVAICMAPIVGLVLLLHFTGLSKFSNQLFVNFIVGTALVYVGQIFFLVGVDNGIMPMGEMVGSTVTKKGKLPMILAFGLLFGFLATIAEPAVQVLGSQVNSVDGNIGKLLIMIVVSTGVGIFVAVALYRILKGIKLRTILLISYILIFGFAIIVQLVAPEFLAVAFDSGGVTTGPVTVPFILALGLGVAAVRAGSKSEDSFGIVGLASAGPILAILILGVILGGDSSGGGAFDTSVGNFGVVLVNTLKDVAIGLSPIIVIFLFFQFAFIKLSKKKLSALLINSAIMFFGLWLFLTGVNYGFSASGTFIGETLGKLSYRWIIIPIAGLIGFAVVYTEPSIVVLGKQVETVTHGHISKKVLLNALAICIAVAVALGATRALYGLSLWWFIVPGYVITIILMFFSPPIFTAIAFDSGGVASGTLTSTFILPFIIGVCSSTGESILMFAFGVVAIIAMMPLITLQALGVMYKIKENKHLKQQVKQTPEALDDIMLSVDTVVDVESLKQAAADLQEVNNDMDFSGLN